MFALLCNMTNLQAQYPQQNYYQQMPDPIPLGGMTAWAIVIILFCTIVGIVALVKVRGINNAVTYEEQQQRLKSAKTWLIVGSVLSVLSVLSMIGSYAAAGMI